MIRVVSPTKIVGIETCARRACEGSDEGSYATRLGTAAHFALEGAFTIGQADPIGFVRALQSGSAEMAEGYFFARTWMENLVRAGRRLPRADEILSAECSGLPERMLFRIEKFPGIEFDSPEERDRICGGTRFFLFLTPELLLTGSWDVLLRLPKPDAVLCRDYKSGKNKDAVGEEAQSDGYALGVFEAYEWCNEVLFQAAYLRRPLDVPKPRRYLRADLVALREKVTARAVAADLKRMERPLPAGPHRWCKYCSLYKRKDCSEGEEYVARNA